MSNLFLETKNLIQLLLQYYQRYNQIVQWDDFLNSSESELNEKTVVFNTVRGSTKGIHLHIDLFLGRWLAGKGADVKILLDDGCLKHWDATRKSQRGDVVNGKNINWQKLSPYNNPSKKDRLTFWCALNSLIRGYDHDNLDILYYSNILDSQDGGSVDLSEIDYKDAERSTVRFFEDGFYRESDILQHKFYQKSLENCKVSKKVGRYVLEKYSPNLFITSHGFYSIFGPCYNLIAGESINTVIYNYNFYRKGHLQLKENNFNFHHSKWFQSFYESDLTKEQRTKAENILENRINLKEENADLHFSHYQGNFNNVTHYSDKDKTNIYVAFPNVAWDVASGSDKGAYDNVIEWLEDTIKLMDQSKDQLIIRFHPSETSHLKGAKPLKELLLEKDSTIFDSENITVIDSDEPVNSYELASETDMALVYNGTLGHELPYMGIPVIGVSDGRFTDDFVFQPTSKDEYYNWLRNPDDLFEKFEANGDSIREDNLKYVYYVYYKNSYRLPILSKKNNVKIDYEIKPFDKNLEIMSLLKDEILD